MNMHTIAGTPWKVIFACTAMTLNGCSGNQAFPEGDVDVDQDLADVGIDSGIDANGDADRFVLPDAEFPMDADHHDGADSEDAPDSETASCPHCPYLQVCVDGECLCDEGYVYSAESDH